MFIFKPTSWGRLALIKLTLPLLIAFCGSEGALAGPYERFGALIASTETVRSGGPLIKDQRAADLFPTQAMDGGRAVDSSLDYVWGSGERVDITTSVDEQLKFGEACVRDPTNDNPSFNYVFQLFQERINDDDFEDFVLVIECMYDIYFRGVPIKQLGGDAISEVFLVFMCGSSEGLYNCTREYTGHEGNLPMAPSLWPGGVQVGVKPYFKDFNSDGIKDILFFTTNDKSDRGIWNNGLIDESEKLDWFQAYYDLWGKPTRACEWRWYGNPNGWETCWWNSAVQTYAVSTPEGHVVKELEFPGLFFSSINMEVYETPDGGLHLGYDKFFSGEETWFTFNQQTNAFEFVEGTEDDRLAFAPVRKREDWNVTDAIHRVSEFDRVLTKPVVGDFQYMLEQQDLSLVAGPNEETCPLIGSDYNVCQIDQLHILRRSDSGTIEPFIEYRPQELATDVRTNTVVDPLSGETIRGFDDRISIKLHGYWVTYQMRIGVYGALAQLEDRTNAPWYLIVSYSGHTDVLDPGNKYYSEVFNECPADYSQLIEEGAVDLTDPRCTFLEAGITFKYRIDFDSEDLIYEGTLFEYPWVWIAAPATWFEFEDRNEDGWNDINFASEGFGEVWHVSDTNGTLRLVDQRSKDPLWEYGQYAQNDKNGFFDIDGDGLLDFTALMQGSSIADFPEYDPERIYLEVIYGERNVWNEAEVMDPSTIEEQMRDCLLGEGASFTRTGQCYFR